MGSKNVILNGNRMDVLGLVSIQLPGLGVWWFTEDIDDVKAKGAIFRAYREEEEQDMTPSQIEKAQEMARNWKPTTK